MKSQILLFILFIISLEGFSQVSEKKSGVMHFTISRTGNDQKKNDNQSRASSDNIPPVISLQSPVLLNDSVCKSNTKSLVVRGKVTDAGGIFEIYVNDVEAKVSSDGTFLAEIPQAIGRNEVKVRATDISLNNTYLKFISVREGSQIVDQPAVIVPVKPMNTYSITVTSPSADGYTTATDKFTLQACVKGTGTIKKIMISRNGSFVNGFLPASIIAKGDCSFQVEEPLSLKLGINELKIEVFAVDDTLSKVVTVDYSLYAARNFALLIGNERYDDPEINNLEEPVKDVTELYNVLTTEYNYDPANIILLKNETKEKIIGTLHELRSKIAPNDNLLIFYAGHGYWDEGMQVGYWLPKNAVKSNPVNWIPNTDLTNYLGAIKTKHTLLIADACFSGGIFKTRAAFSATYAVEMLYQLNSRKAITSGNFNNEVPDKSVFFQYLIKNLKENANDYLSAEELFSKMRMAVMNNSETVPQFGTIQNVGDEGGDYIFIKKKGQK